MLMLWLSILSVCSVVLVVVCTDPNPTVISVARDHSHHDSTHTRSEDIHSKYDSSISQDNSDQHQSSFSDETVCSQPDGTCEIHKISEYSDSAANQDRFPRTENEVPVSDISSLHDDRTSLQRTEWETLDQESKGSGNSRTNEDQSHKDSAEITSDFGSSQQYSVLQDVSIKEDVNTSFSFKDKDGITEEAADTKGALIVLHQVGDFENFIEKGEVVIVYFYRESGSEALSRFLTEYSNSAEHLLRYHVLLSKVNCAEYNVATYCLPDKINRFAYGFRDGMEKIALPLDTLFNNNAIVASALHLALINSVPILQTSGERRDLEGRCHGRCDIIFSFLHTLGTFEHRMFLEVAYAHQDSFVFAITTYRAGTLGLSDTHPEEERENTLWVVHCADKAVDEECVVSHYRRKMEQTQLLQFIHALQLPMWHELALLPTTLEVVTPYDGSGLPWVLLLHDTSSHNRVRSLAPHLAQLLHGSVATMTVNLDLVSEAALMKLGLARQAITAPAVAFLQPGQQESASLLNDYDDALEWVNEQLSAMLQQVPLTKEEQGYLPVQALEELQQDDEVVLGMVKEDSFNNVPFLAGPVPYTSTLSTNTLSVIAFYLAWDPVSNALLQHLNAIASVLHDYGSQASLHRVNCFDWPNFCDTMGVSTYPVLRLHPKGRRNITYEGPIHGDYILKAILLYERATPLELVSTRELKGLLALNVDLHPACKVAFSVAVGIFPSAKDSVAFTEASRVLEGSHLMGRHISPHAVHTLCKTNHGCVVVSKPGDKFQPSQVLNKEVDKPGAITRFVSHASLPVLAPLDPERYSALLVGVEKDEYSPVSNQHVIILFLPAKSSLPGSSGEKEFESRKPSSQHHAQEDSRSHKGVDLTNGPDDIWSMIGHLAAELSEPGFVFSWLLCDDPLASEILPVYGLSPEVWSLVGVSQRESLVHVFTDRDSSEDAVRDWLSRLRAGHLQPSIKLPGREWEPRLPGFDYLKFMLEDQDRDAEDHLILEMEADLSAHHQQEESSKVKKLAHEEL